jgi:hypothetical protein
MEKKTKIDPAGRKGPLLLRRSTLIPLDPAVLRNLRAGDDTVGTTSTKCWEPH